MRVGVLCSRIRVEEKLLFEALTARGVASRAADTAVDSWTGYGITRGSSVKIEQGGYDHGRMRRMWCGDHHRDGVRGR